MPAYAMLRHGPPDTACIHLTFDDGPDPEWTPHVLDLLAQAGAVATFFIVGRSARARPQIVRRIVDAGHELGNHTFTHTHPWVMSSTRARQEVRDGAAAIADTTGARCTWFRPPHGRLRHCMAEEARAQGERTVLWSRSAVDWGPLGTRTGVARRLRAARPGDIVLLHDAARGPNRPGATCAALPWLLAEWKERGLRPDVLPR